MDVRLGDLYEFIIHIVYERLKRWVETERSPATKGKNLSSPNSCERSTNKDEALMQTLLEQISKLVNLQQQLLEFLQSNQKRIETIFDDLLKAIK